MGYKKENLSFMTWNLYVGADLSPILTATTNQLPQRFTEVFLQFLQTNFHFRVRAIARQITLKKPEIIGFQEVERFQIHVPKTPVVTFDYLDMLLNELRKMGLHYEVAARNTNFNVKLPLNKETSLTFWDSDVLLFSKEARLKVLHVKEENFKTNQHLQIGGYPFEIQRGWSLVDFRCNKGIFRVINTHLESDSPGIQVAQGDELLNGPAFTNLPLIVLGDLNSNADGTGTITYENFLAAGFQDVWTKVGRGNGYTCCQAANLMNPVSNLDSRIDFILFKNGWIPKEADLVGNKQADRTLTGLWPSDHAGVVACLNL